MEKLNLEVESFDAGLALKSDQVILPFPDVRPLSNLAEYESMVLGKRSKGPKKKPEARIVLPVKTTPQRREKTVLTMMENAKGPLGFLNKCLKDRIMVKVWTRRHQQIRGVCKGYLEAFDHHWNLVMSDVDEFFTVPTKLKSLPNGSEIQQVSSEDHQKGSSKMITQQRHASQLFVRGDNVAFISISNT